LSNPYAKKLNTVVFDIETMGLVPTRDMLINAGFCNPETLECKQLFAESTSDEERLLREILEILSDYDVVITYNGDRFDIPFVKTRCKKYGIEFKPLIWSIDMYRYLKSYWPMAEKMPRLNQKSVEIALGLSDKRTDEIDGGECIPLYERYLLDGDEEAKRLILLHNADDIRQLAKIYNASVFLPYDRIAFERGFAVKFNERILVNSLRLDKGYLYIEAKKASGGIPSSIYENAYELEYDCFTGEIKAKLSLSSRDDGMRYVDLMALPAGDGAFKDLKGYHSGFLVLSDQKGINYHEIIMLVSSFLSSEGMF